MKNYLITFVILVLSANYTICQEDNYNNLSFHYYNVKFDIKSKEKAVYLSNKIISIENIVFSVIDHKTNELTVLAEKAFDDSDMMQTLFHMGIVLEYLGTSEYTNDLFLDYYYMSDMNRKEENILEKPRFIKTGNPDKDNLNYSNAKVIWMNKYPNEYNKLLNKKPITEEQQNEINIKSNMK